MATRMFCSERRRLLNLYSQATAQLATMISGLAAQAGNCESDAFDQAWEACEEARYRCSQIQQSLCEHIQRHRCAMEVTTTTRA